MVGPLLAVILMPVSSRKQLFDLSDDLAADNSGTVYLSSPRKISALHG